jgi:hypothetical protein
VLDDKIIQKYKVKQGLFLTVTFNKLFMHKHTMTQEVCSFQMPTPFYGQVAIRWRMLEKKMYFFSSIPLVSWLSLSNKNELQLSFIHFEIGTMKPSTFSLMGHSLLAHVFNFLMPLLLVSFHLIIG